MHLLKISWFVIVLGCFGVLFYQRYILNAFELQLNIATRQAATARIKKVMENVEQLGKTEVQKCVNDNSKNVQSFTPS